MKKRMNVQTFIYQASNILFVTAMLLQFYNTKLLPLLNILVL